MTNVSASRATNWAASTAESVTAAVRTGKQRPRRPQPPPLIIIRPIYWRSRVPATVRRPTPAAAAAAPSSRRRRRRRCCCSSRRCTVPCTPARYRTIDPIRRSTTAARPVRRPNRRPAT